MLSALGVGLLSGCTSAASSAGAASAGGSGGDSAATGAQASSGRAAKTGVDRSITVTGDLQLSAADPVRAAAAVAGVVTGAGGRVQTDDEHPGRRSGSADLTVRIPSAAFTATLRSIERQGRVTAVSERSTDVTSQVTDYAVRLAGLRTSITRLQTLLARSTTTTDLVRIESSLTTRQTDLEQLLAEQKDLNDQVAFATLSIAIRSPDVVARPAPSTFVTGFGAGLAGLVAALAWTGVLLGVLLPWLLLTAVVALVVLGARRLLRRRTRRPASS